MQRMRNSSILLVVMGLAFGMAVARVEAQEQRGDADGDRCIDNEPGNQEVPEWEVPPMRLAGPPTTLADPNGPPNDVGPSLYRFTLLEGEVLLSACDSEGEVVIVVEGPVKLTVTSGESYVTFRTDAPPCEPLPEDPMTCLLTADPNDTPSDTATLGNDDVAYHPAEARYEYVVESVSAGQAGTPISRNGSTVAHSAGGVRAASAPLAQQRRVVDVIAKGNKPRGCGGDCI